MKYVLLCCFLLHISALCAQNPPWGNPLRMAWSADGASFGPSTIFQDSSGVPSLIRWKGDTLIAAFQWFRLPQNTPTWDRVAVKFSYDAGLSWTAPTPVVMNGMPPNYQRPFDPTLVSFAGDSLRMYFSSSNGQPSGGLTEIVNCYSAKSKDGIHFQFEQDARVDHPSKPLIDPAVVFFNNAWHYTAPAGAPQDGAHHYVSPNGLIFSPVPSIPSDNQHNWTGNFMINQGTELRFYGSGPNIWYNTSQNGGQWTGFANTNIQGGDPSVLQVSNNNYLMVYVGKPYSTGLESLPETMNQVTLSPNPARDQVLFTLSGNNQDCDFSIYTAEGRLVKTGRSTAQSIGLSNLPAGHYYLKLAQNGKAIGQGQFIKVE